MMKFLLMFLLLFISEENKEYIVYASIYHAKSGETDQRFLETADGSIIDIKNPQKWIGLSRDLLNVPEQARDCKDSTLWRGNFKYGDKVKIVGTGKLDGIYTIHDAMNSRYRMSIDILVDTSVKTGSWKNIKLIKLQ